LNRPQPLPDDLAWRRIIDLGAQLMQQPAGDEARRLILATAEQTGGGQATLWLDAASARGWADASAAEAPDQPPTELMRAALTERRPISALTADGQGHAVALPFVGRQTVLGVLQVTRPAGPPFSPDDLERLRGLSIQCAIALDAARQVAIERWRIEQLTLVRQVSAQVAGLLDLDELLRRIADLILSTFGYYYVALFTLEKTPPPLRFRASAGPADRQTPVAVNVQMGQGIIGWVAAHGSEIVANAVCREPRYRHENALPETRAEMALPLKIGDRVLGVLDVQSDEEDAFDETDILVLRALADTIALAVRNAELYHAERWQRRTEAYASAAVLQVAEALARLDDLDAVLAWVVRATPLLVGVARCLIFLWDERAARFRLAECYGLTKVARERLLNRTYTEDEFPLLYAVRGSGDVTAGAVEAWPGESSALPSSVVADLFEPVAEGRGRRVVVLPLTVKTDVFGALVVQEATIADEARPKWLEILSDIAQQTALSIQNYRYRQEMAERERMDRELQVARAIQQTFLPREMPGLRGWDLAMAWRPARQVGGDFYDFFELPDGRLGLVIADVADKGIPAALFMALTRTLVRAAARLHPSPAAALGYANALMTPDAHRGMFVTAVYGVVTLATGQLVYANAGHLPPLIWRHASARVEEAARGEIALGVQDRAEYRDHVVTLAPGDCLILYTDGITDALSPTGEMFGLERVRALLNAARCESAGSLLQAIDAAVSAFSADTPPADDLTMAVLHRKTEEGHG
jgi:serine phosphatase RsbU (regulator of sigma subunit)/putative methionine-R-sulfoxide reductase with GAF domain